MHPPAFLYQFSCTKNDLPNKAQRQENPERALKGPFELSSSCCLFSSKLLEVGVIENTLWPPHPCQPKLHETSGPTSPPPPPHARPAQMFPLSSTGPCQSAAAAQEAQSFPCSPHRLEYPGCESPRALQGRSQPESKPQTGLQPQEVLRCRPRWPGGQPSFNKGCLCSVPSLAMRSSSEAVPLAVNFTVSQSYRPATHLRRLGGTGRLEEGMSLPAGQPGPQEALVKVSPETTVL